jgi:hypothetical protein
MKRVLITIAAATLGCIALLALMSINWRNLDGTGKIVDFYTRTPLPNATLLIDCRKSGVIHGSTSARVLRVTSDNTGAYSASFRQTWDCDYVSVSAETDGYQQRASLDTNAFSHGISKSVPKVVYLIGDNDGARLILEQIWHQTSPYRSLPQEPLDAYRQLFIAFNKSRNIATSKGEADWVADRYCALLESAHSELSAEQMAALPLSVLGTFEAKVAPYCLNPGVIPESERYAPGL